MITLFKKFKKIPKLHDFVITKQAPNKIGQIILVFDDKEDPKKPLYQVEYPNDEKIRGSVFRGRENTFFPDEIVHWSKNKKDIEPFAEGEKFGI